MEVQKSRAADELYSEDVPTLVAEPPTSWHVKKWCLFSFSFQNMSRFPSIGGRGLLDVSKYRGIRLVVDEDNRRDVVARISSNGGWKSPPGATFMVNIAVTAVWWMLQSLDFFNAKALTTQGSLCLVCFVQTVLLRILKMISLALRSRMERKSILYISTYMYSMYCGKWLAWEGLCHPAV